MIGLFSLFLALVASPFKSKSRLEAENAVLRHQLPLLHVYHLGRRWQSEIAGVTARELEMVHFKFNITAAVRPAPVN